MKIDNVLAAIDTCFERTTEKYVVSEWRDTIMGLVENTNKFNALIKWIDETIETYSALINVTGPVTLTPDYTNGMFNEYMENLKNVAFLIHCKTLLTNYRCTKEEKEKIEYALEKVFNICYSEELKTYI